MWGAIHWLCATKSVTTVVCGGTRAPSRASDEIATAGVAWTVTTRSGARRRSSAPRRCVPRRVSPKVSTESLAIQSANE